MVKEAMMNVQAPLLSIGRYVYSSVDENRLPVQQKAEKSLEDDDGSDRRAGQHGLCVTDQETKVTIDTVRASTAVYSSSSMFFFHFGLPVCLVLLYGGTTGVVCVALTVVGFLVDEQVEPRYAHLQGRLRLPIQKQQHQQQWQLAKAVITGVHS